jgi:DNA invertase Pin-like site-specific DNA recombinase
MLIGYARISTFDQNSDLQKDALEKAGCEKIFTDTISGTVSQRPGLAKIKEILRKGDTLVVWRLDRLGRSLKDLIDWINYLDTEGVALKSIQESIDTTTATGILVFHVFGALAEFERNLILERTQAGLSAARARGRLGGRPNSLNNDKKQVVIDLYNERKLTVKKICEMMDISKPTLYCYVRDSVAKPVSNTTELLKL